MKVEAYLRAQIPGYPFELAVLEYAAMSPIFATPEMLQAISLEDSVEYQETDEDWVKSLKYATSTLLYAVSGGFSGGSRSERVGDIQTSQSGYYITRADREFYRSKADKLRREIGADVEANADDGGMFDATNLGRF